MAGTFQVTPQSLRDKASELRKQKNSLVSHIESLRSQENGLSGMWEGDAHETFRREFTKDVERMYEFCSAIEQYAAALEAIAAQYDSAESRNTNIAATRMV